jgi:DNA-binding IclR family transcriptional regulator
MLVINHRAPTVRELAHVLGWSASKVHRTLLVLRTKGYATWQYNTARTLQVTPAENMV